MEVTECCGAEHIPPLLLVFQPGLSIGLDMVQVSGFEKPQQRLPLLCLSSRFQAEIAALAPHPYLTLGPELDFPLDLGPAFC